MNKTVSIRQCSEYDPGLVSEHIASIYESSGGPEVRGRKVLLKPNILNDHDPSRCITTHPVVVEAMVKFLQSKGARVSVGDSPSIHLPSFKPVKCGMLGVCERTGTDWINFTEHSVDVRLKRGSIRVASAVLKADIVISVPKLKTHELVYFSGAVKNTLGIVPAFHKAKQHAIHYERESFSRFLVDLNEAVTPHYFLMDGIIGMQGPGPANGLPAKTAVLLGSVNPAALDIAAVQIAGYDPMAVPTNRIAVERGLWLSDPEEIIIDGPAPRDIAMKGFIRVPVSRFSNISVKFIANRISLLRRLQRRPVFISSNCTGCHKCIKICPVKAIDAQPGARNRIILTDSKCIRCFCCSEVCPDNAVEIRRKLF